MLGISEQSKSQMIIFRIYTNSSWVGVVGNQNKKESNKLLETKYFMSSRVKTPAMARGVPVLNKDRFNMGYEPEKVMDIYDKFYDRNKKSTILNICQ